MKPCPHIFERFCEPGWGFVINELDLEESVDGCANWSDPVMADIYRVYNVEVTTAGNTFPKTAQKRVDTLG